MPSERRDVDEQDVPAHPEDTGLQGRAQRDDLVRVDALVGLLATGELLDQVGDGRHAGRATDEDHVVDVGDLDPRVLDDVLERLLGPVEGSLVICSNWARVSVSSRWMGPFSDIERYCSEMLVELAGGELFLACSAASRSRCMAILSLEKVDTGVVLHRGEQVLDDAVVPVVATELVVTAGRLDLDRREAVVGSLPTSRRDTSKVPPPRSKTRMSSSSLPLSRP